MDLALAASRAPQRVLAEDDFLADTAATSQWLAEHCTQPLGAVTYTHSFWVDVSDATVDELWALMLTGTAAECLDARYELRQRLLDACRDAVDARLQLLLQEAGA